MKFSNGVDSDDEDYLPLNVTLFDTSHLFDETKAVIIETQQPVQAIFPIEYLLYVIEATPLSTGVQLSVSADYPMLVEYVMKGCGYIRYYLAPLASE